MRRRWDDLLTSFRDLCGLGSTFDDQWAWLQLVLDKDEFDTVWFGWHASHPGDFSPLEEALLDLTGDTPF